MPATPQTGFQPARAALLFCVVVLGSFPPLSSAQTNNLSANDELNWAKEREFWSFRQPVAQIRPTVKNRSWPAQPLDYFILARIEKKALAPSPEADKRTLLRRATFDLAGLPPTPD